VTSVKVGLTLPSFVDDAEVPIAVARAAERAGLDGVFVFDHLFRRSADGTQRPALEGLSLLGAVAAETQRIAVGTLVARASLRPAATLAVGLETARRVSGGRLIAAIGAGDEESRAENESFGLEFGSFEDRLAQLGAAVTSARDRGFPVWVGGTAPAVRELAATHADGWNRWGGDAARFATQAAAVTARAVRRPFTVSWGGLVIVGGGEEEVAAKAAHWRPGPHVLVGTPEGLADALRAYVEAGAAWVILGPVDSTDTGNAELVARVRSLL